MSENRIVGGAGVLEVADSAIVRADQGVIVSITVQIDEHRRAARANAHAIEGIACAGLRRKHRRRGAAGIEIKTQAAVGSADDNVKIAVAVDIHESRCGTTADVNAIERIGGAGTLHVTRFNIAADVLEVSNRPGVGTHEDIQVTITVNVNEYGLTSNYLDQLIGIVENELGRVGECWDDLGGHRTYQEDTPDGGRNSPPAECSSDGR